MGSGAPQNKTLRSVRNAKGKNTTLDDIKIKRYLIAKILSNLKKKKKKANFSGEGKSSKESLEKKLELKHEGSTTSTTTAAIDKKDEPKRNYTWLEIAQMTDLREKLKGLEAMRLSGFRNKCNCGNTTSSGSGSYSYSEEVFSPECSDVEQDDARSKP